MPILFYYYKKGLKPFLSLMEKSDDEATDFMRTTIPEDTVFHKNPQAYLRRRQETERWLHEEFCRLGGSPQTFFPIYFTVGRSSYIEDQKIYAEVLQLPLSVFRADCISFTYPDSYVSRWLAETKNHHFDANLHGRVFTLPDLPALLSNPVIKANAWKTAERKYDLFLEAQVWDYRFLACHPGAWPTTARP